MKKVRNAVGNVIDKISYIGYAVIFLLMLITTIDVILRKVSTFSIVGSYELTEMGMVIIVFLGIASFQVVKGHVLVDMFVTKFPGRSRLITEAVVLLVECVAVGFLVYGNYEKMLANGARGITTSNLLLPTWPFCLVMLIGSCFFLLLLIIDLIIAVKDAAQYRKPRREEVAD